VKAVLVDGMKKKGTLPEILPDRSYVLFPVSKCLKR
jgi:hypothetical protein